MRVAINGAGVAGPTLAYWLHRAGHDVLLIEESPQLRSGGYVIDFWGVGYDIAEKMNVIPRVRALGYQVEEVRFVDERGRTSGGFSTDVFRRMTGGRFTSLRRSDLAATIYAALGGAVETVFGDSVAAIEERGDRVRLGFDHAPPCDVDVVIGADGLHSRVRGLVFASQADPEVSLGYHVAAFAVAGYRPRDELVYVSHALPGRQVSRFALRDDETLFLFVFGTEHLDGRRTQTDAARRAALSHIFATAGWECPQILAAMDHASSIYFDRVSQIRLQHWTRGRAGLIGDAAACVSLLAGEGTGLAMAEAYVLAGELSRCGGEPRLAFERYEQRLMPFLARKQAAAARFASSFAPRSALGIWMRDVVTRLLRFPAAADFFLGRDLLDDIELPDYAL